MSDRKADLSERPYTAHLVPHTHWDREWYRPFQIFRARLVAVIDGVLELLRDPDYRRFTLDGQAIVLEDYLAVRPEREEELRAHVRDGRLRIGPWFVLADEFLVSPEALVRNLMLGHTICRRFGEPMPVGYTPDSFGHIAQLPLVLRGFGLDSIVFERGVGDEGERLRGEFVWVAADGASEVFAVHLTGTYSPLAGVGHRDWELRDPYDAERAQRQTRAALYGSDGQDIADLPEWLRESFTRLEGGVSAYSTGEALLLLNGSDHLFAQRNLRQILDDLNAGLPEVRFVQSDVEAFVKAAREGAGGLERYQGEFRGSRYQHILSGVLSARLYLKQANHHAETLLERYAEPLCALAWLKGQPYPKALLWQAWRLLLENHPHDSICGCSIDPVHREMMTRFDGVMQLGDYLSERALAQMTAAQSAADLAAAEALPETPPEALVVFNPLPYPRRAVLEHTLDLPGGQGARLRLRDAAGALLPAQLEVASVYAPGRSDRRIDRTTLRVLAELEPLSLTSLSLSVSEESAVPEPGRTADHAVHVSEQELENRFLKVALEDGNLHLTDKASGARYPLDLRFEDQADAGDSYDFSPLPGDAPLTLPLDGAVTLLRAGPLVGTLHLRGALELPERLSDDRRRREGEGKASLPFRLELSLRADSPLLHLALELDNRAEDHRLRLRVASGCRSERVWADGHFGVLERSARPPGGEGWFQAPQGTNHQRHFLAVSDGAKGLAIFNKGLPEYEAVPTPKGLDLAVTLLRAVGWLSREDLKSRPQGAGPSLPAPEAQCLGPQRYELALFAFQGPWWESGLVAEAQAFVAPPKLAAASGEAASAFSLELSPPLVLSACKRAEDRDSLVIRVYNPAPVAVRGSLELARPPRESYRVRLDETREAALDSSSRLSLTLAANEVVSFEFVFKEVSEG